jgi:membrane associated rhomboid family serine protease
VRVPFGEITHVAVGRRGIWIGRHRGTMLLLRGQFAEKQGPESLERALLDAIGARPSGIAQLARFIAIDRLSRRHRHCFAGLTVGAVCVLVYALQTLDPFAEDAGAFVPSLVSQGEVWRVLTGNFFHLHTALPIHLGLNVVGLMFLCLLVERPLGPLPIVFVMGASALGEMAVCALVGYSAVFGASGIVFGLLGAALCLELHFPERLPVWWRVPRTLIYALLIWEFATALLAPVFAAGAHLGGFVAGYLATRVVARGALLSAPTATWVRASVIALAFATLASFVAAGPLIVGHPSAVQSYARNLLRTEDLHPSHFNKLAWRMATEGTPSADQLMLAEQLAGRAVAETQRQNPDWLDTLAEVLFAMGDREAAVATIDEAIHLAPHVEYFWEQRRRFTGERGSGDRPEYPGLPWFDERRRDPAPPEFFDRDVEI